MEELCPVSGLVLRAQCLQAATVPSIPARLFRFSKSVFFAKDTEKARAIQGGCAWGVQAGLQR
eukprot:5064560-Prymnesium_polylepis.1